jgi:VanZ family protein
MNVAVPSENFGDIVMSALPIELNSSPGTRTSISSKQPTGLRKHWVPVIYALIFICFTSTSFMGGGHTGIVVHAVWKALFGTWHIKLAGEINYMGRKVGHFFGYGMVGLIFRNAWYKTAQACSLVVKVWLYPFAAFLAVASTFTVGALDEYHQMFVPGRVGCLHDALLDTSGALFLNLVFLAVIAYKRKDAQRSNLSFEPARA